VGRIEDALAKLRAQRASVGAVAARPSIGSVVDSAGVAGSREQPYGGKHIAIDMDQLRAHGLLAPGSQERKLADEYRTIKRPLLDNASKSPEPVLDCGNLLMVASALSGEGKTFTCLNLCLSIARERDWKVVLVDADCAKRDLTSLFGARDEQGLMDLLRDPKLDFRSLVMPTDVPGLFVLPGGQRDEHAAELLASARMATLCAELSSGDSRTMIVFDSAPLLLTSEAPVLASQVGQVLFVVRAHKTPQRAVFEARDKLDPSKAIGFLLNQASGNTVSGYGYSDSSYGT
jgi:exopolysaccharide/PEP-CTERM locus tyrosine autokinase